MKKLTKNQRRILCRALGDKPLSHLRYLPFFGTAAIYKLRMKGLLDYGTVTPKGLEALRPKVQCKKRKRRRARR